jgi:hypothetical protein
MGECKFKVKFGPTWWCELNRKSFIMCVDDTGSVCNKKVVLESNPSTKDSEVAQLKEKIAEVAIKLEKFNYYGANYHKREIQTVIDELKQISGK